MLDNLHFTKELGYKSLAALESGNLEEFARLMDVHWQRKKARARRHEQRRRSTNGTTMRWPTAPSAEN